MRMKKKSRCITAVLLSLCMVAVMPGIAAVGGTAIESTGLYEHHIGYAEDSGYAESQSCSHTKHMEACYTERLICGYILDEEEAPEQTASESDADIFHEHTWECHVLDCPHERGVHDETCGYREEMPDSPNLFAINDRFVADGISYKEIGSDQAQVIDGESASGEVVIPETVTDSNTGKSYTVISIGNKAFYQNREIETITFPDTITEIGNFAFWQCSGLKGTLELPDQLESIGERAFNECTGFSGKLELPSTLQTIGDFAFHGCENFTEELSLPDNILSIGEEAFLGCTGFTNHSVMLPKSLQSIGKSAFGELRCNTLDYEVALLAFYSGHTIFWRDQIFQGNTVTFDSDNLKFEIITGKQREVKVVSPLQDSGTLTIPETVEYNERTYTVTVIGAFAFSEKNKFTGGLKLPASLQSIEDGGFYACTGLTGNLELPANLQNIGRGAFGGCIGFDGELRLPDSIENIGSKAFEDCDGISSIHVGSGIKTIGMDAFPAGTPLATDSPRVQLLLVRYLDMESLPLVSWNGKEDVLPGAIVMVDRDITLSGNITVGEEAKITISPEATVTVEGALVNHGTIINHGTITVNGGGSMETADGVFHNFGMLDGNGQLPDESSYNHKKAAVTLEVSEENPAYGTDVALTVAITEEALPKVNALSRLSAEAPPKTVFIYCDGKEIGKAVIEDEGEKKATFPIAWENEIWTIGSHIITAKYTGSNDQLLPSESQEVMLNIKKGNQPRAQAPTVKGEPVETTVTLNTQIGQMYLFTETGDTPDTSSGTWEKAEEDTLSFSGLAPFTDYYFWTYIPGDEYYHDSPVSPALRVTTRGNEDQKAVEEAKSAIESGIYTVPQASAGTEAALKQVLAGTINGLTEVKRSGITVTEADINLTIFKAAVAGNAVDPDGADGSFSFTVSLTKGAASCTTGRKDGKVTAAPYLSSNATLSSLTVTEADLYPTFDPATVNYTASVGYWVSSVTITATAADKGATVWGDTGIQPLKVGSNLFYVTVTAADGSVTTYTITITRARYSGGSGSSSDSESYSSGANSGVTVQTSAGADIPTIGITPPLTPDKDGTVTVMDEPVSSAISAARQDARNKGNTEKGIAVSIPVNIVNGQTGFRVVISASVLDQLIAEQVTRLDIEAGSMVSYSFPLDTLKELRMLAGDGNIILRTEKQMGLAGSALAAIGSRPVFGISISYMKNGAEVPVPALNGTAVTVKLPYALIEEETPDTLCAAYVDDAGTLHRITNAIYNPGQTAMIFEVRYFGIYGIADFIWQS